MLLHFVVFLNATLAYVVYPYEGKSVVEGVTLYNSMRYLHGEQPYHSPDELPFRSLVYPPAHEMILAGFLWIVGPSLYAARIFSLLCVLGAALTVGLTVRRHTKNWPASFFGGMLVFCCYGLTGQWLEQVRSDALMLLLLALGTSLADRAVSRNRIPLGGLVVLLLAVYHETGGDLCAGGGGAVSLVPVAANGDHLGRELRGLRAGGIRRDGGVERRLVFVLHDQGSVLRGNGVFED